MNASTLAILAPGLLGASVAQAARHYQAAERIQIWARRPETRISLEGTEWCDQACETPQQAARGADLVVICTPVDRIVELTGAIHDSLSPEAIVTDVGSVKGDICRLASAALGQPGRFIGSHPMAGSEKSGMEFAEPDLFKGRPCFVTPFDDTPDAKVETIVRFWHQLGAEVVTTHPDKHDEIVAHVSHLPHVVASTLCSLLADREPSWHLRAGGGLRDTTRVASGNPQLWVEILLQNRDEVLRSLSAYQDELQAFQSALDNRDLPQLNALLKKGKTYRDQF